MAGRELPGAALAAATMNWPTHPKGASPRPWPPHPVAAASEDSWRAAAAGSVSVACAHIDVAAVACAELMMLLGKQHRHRSADDDGRSDVEVDEERVECDSTRRSGAASNWAEERRRWEEERAEMRRCWAEEKAQLLRQLSALMQASRTDSGLPVSGGTGSSAAYDKSVCLTMCERSTQTSPPESPRLAKSGGGDDLHAVSHQPVGSLSGGTSNSATLEPSQTSKQTRMYAKAPDITQCGAARRVGFPQPCTFLAEGTVTEKAVQYEMELKRLNSAARGPEDSHSSGEGAHTARRRRSVPGSFRHDVRQ